MKRDADSILEYYRFEGEYKEEYFVDEDKRLLKFDLSSLHTPCPASIAAHG